MSTTNVYDVLGPRLPRWPCELCGAPAGTDGICLGCRDDLPWIGPACPACARPLPVARCCEHCAPDAPPWTRAVVPLAWRFPVDTLVGRFKYGSALHFGAMLGRLLARHCSGRPVDAVVPVPLHPARQIERGFNQALELARPVAGRLRLPLLAAACARLRPTPPQAGLDAAARAGNLRGAFAASAAVAGLRVAIVDDVFTTGSTARALAEALLAAGAAGVEVWAVARGGTAQPAAKV